MGGAVSAGQNNSELVDNLCMDNYIRTPEVERVFRMVDRADFMVFPDDQDSLEAYEDHAWRRGKLHLSAPCIYSRAVEALQFKKGVSFLNIGSGTGYLSTMAGLLIGPYGINHGVEIYPENVEFAAEKQETFLEKFAQYDPLEYCEPLFVVGNGLLLSPGNLLYDRIYCGAACPPEHIQLMKNMLAVGGILVMPHDNQLESVHRVSQTKWKTDVVLPSVSFAPLILPSQETVKELEALEISVQPFSLKQLCRLVILQYLGRDKYCRVCDLPLPQHLKDFVAHFKTWTTSLPPIKTLCPIDHSSKRSTENDKLSEGAEGGAEAEGGGGASRHDGARGEGDMGDLGWLPRAQSMRINGQRMLVCNINGMFFQIPLNNRDSNAAEEGEEEDGSDEMDGESSSAEGDGYSVDSTKEESADDDEMEDEEISEGDAVESASLEASCDSAMEKDSTGVIDKAKLFDKGDDLEETHGPTISEQ